MRYLLFVILLLSGQSLVAQVYVNATVSKNDGSSINMLVKTPFPTGKSFKYKITENGKSQKMRLDKIKMVKFNPGTESEIILKHTKYWLNRVSDGQIVGDTELSKSFWWLRVVDSCDKIEYLEQISLCYGTRFDTYVMYHSISDFYTYHYQRNGEEFPTRIASHLNPTIRNQEGNDYLQELNQMLLVNYFKNDPMILDELDGMPITLKSLGEFMRFICD